MAMDMCRRSTPSLLFCAFVCVLVGVVVVVVVVCVCVCFFFFFWGGGEYKKNGVTLIIVDV